MHWLEHVSTAIIINSSLNFSSIHLHFCLKRWTCRYNREVPHNFQNHYFLVRLLMPLSILVYYIRYIIQNVFILCSSFITYIGIFTNLLFAQRKVCVPSKIQKCIVAIRWSLLWHYWTISARRNENFFSIYPGHANVSALDSIRICSNGYKVQRSSKSSMLIYPPL